jgi:3-hydroxyacyl-CoA dehydrogenase
VPRSTLSVYRRQPFPDQILGEERHYGETVFENEGVRCWHTGDDLAVVSFKSRMHAIGEDVLDGLLESIEIAERDFSGLVIWQTEPPFSVGANLKKDTSGRKREEPSAVGRLFKKLKREAESLALKAARQIGVADQLMAGRLAEVEKIVEKFQLATHRLRYSTIPTVAAVDGLALGGGCELVMHCDRAVAALESYIGLVEAGVGLLPAGGGCKEAAMRAAQEARGADLFAFIRRYFEVVAKADVARSAEHAKELGYLRSSDVTVMNRFELLTVAKAQLAAMAQSAYRPPLRPRAIPVAGRSAIATLQAYMVNMRDGGFISDHDYLVGCKIAIPMCGGDVEAGSLVDEDWLLHLERVHFMELLATEKTQARIEHTLKTGKPLRN